MGNTSSTGKRTRQSETTSEQHPEKRHQKKDHHLDTIDSRVGLVQQFPDPENVVATRNATVE